MPRVRFLKLDAGPGGVRHPGHTVFVSDDEAADLIAAHAAELVDRVPIRETAITQQPETAAAPAVATRPPVGLKVLTTIELLTPPTQPSSTPPRRSRGPK